MASAKSSDHLSDIKSLLKSTNISFSFTDSCPITKDECPDLDSAFSDTNVNLVLAEDGKVASCLGCYMDKEEDRIHISAACSAGTSRRKGFGTLIQIILFAYAQSQNIRYITADTNSKSRPLMEKYLNAHCEDEYMPPFYDNNCIVDVTNPETQSKVKRNMETILGRFKPKTPTRRRIRSRTKSANDALTRSKRSRSKRSRSKRSISAVRQSRSERSRSKRSRSIPSRSKRSRSKRSRSKRSRTR